MYRKKFFADLSWGNAFMVFLRHISLVYPGANSGIEKIFLDISLRYMTFENDLIFIEGLDYAEYIIDDDENYEGHYLKDYSAIRQRIFESVADIIPLSTSMAKQTLPNLGFVHITQTGYCNSDEESNYETSPSPWPPKRKTTEITIASDDESNGFGSFDFHVTCIEVVFEDMITSMCYTSSAREIYLR